MGCFTVESSIQPSAAAATSSTRAGVEENPGPNQKLLKLLLQPSTTLLYNRILALASRLTPERLLRPDISKVKTPYPPENNNNIIIVKLSSIILRYYYYFIRYVHIPEHQRQMMVSLAHHSPPIPRHTNTHTNKKAAIVGAASRPSISARFELNPANTQSAATHPMFTNPPL